MTKRKPFKTPAWIERMVSESHAPAKVVPFPNNDQNVNIVFDAGDLLVSNVMDVRPNYSGSFGRHSIKLRTSDYRVDVSLIGAQYNNADTGNDNRLAERVWRDVLSLLRTGVKRGRPTEIRTGLASLVGEIKLPMWFVAVLTQAAETDHVSWMLAGQYSRDPTKMYALVSFKLRDFDKMSRDGIDIFHATMPNAYLAIMQVK